MVRRVSLKGKGAEIFFGGYTPAPPAEAPMAEPLPPEATGAVKPALPATPPPPVDQQPGTATMLQAAHHLSENVSILQIGTKQAILQESKQESLQVSNEVSKPGSLYVHMRAALASQNLKPNTFRYTQAELDSIRDIVYEMETQFGRKLGKNDVVRIALNWLIHDFQARKQASFLVSFITSKE